MSKTSNKIAVIPADIRKESGTGSARALRRAGSIPAVLYAKGQDAVSISIPLKNISMEYAKGRFKSRLVELKFTDKTVRALPKDLQFDPVSDFIEHADFIKVEADSQIRVEVPVKISGRDKSVGLKRGGVLNIVRHEIEFFCEPDLIPDYIEIDIKSLDISQSVHINDIELPKGAIPTIKRNFTIITISGRGKADDVAETAADSEASAEAKPAEGGEEAKK
ncbi:MAG: 50S ribosomal protein L25/general stress protein Ctc [Rickettsiales bacterium]